MRTKATKNKSSFLLSIVIIIIVQFVGFSILQPKISSRLFIQKRQLLWVKFYTDLITSEQIDTKKFWEFREFYSPGYFKFRRGGLSKQIINKKLNQINLSKYSFGSEIFFLEYSSGYINCIDTLTTESSVEGFIKNHILDTKIPIKKGADYVIFENSSKQVLLVFLVSTNEMKAANGFFDYAEKDKLLVKNKYWSSICSITI